MGGSGKICNMCGRGNAMSSSHCIECGSDSLSFDIENKARKYPKNTNNNQAKSDNNKVYPDNNIHKVLAIVGYGLIALAIFTDNNTLFLAFLLALVMTISSNDNVYLSHFGYQLLTIFILFAGSVFLGFIAAKVDNFDYILFVFPLWIYVGYRTINGFLLLLNNKRVN